MSANITQFPIGTEYVRIYLSWEEDEDKVMSCFTYVMKPFRINLELYREFLTKGFAAVNERIGHDIFNLIGLGEALINQIVNDELQKLDQAGDLLSAESVKLMDVTHIEELFNKSPSIDTCDGYRVFNPMRLPMSPSNMLH